MVSTDGPASSEDFAIISELLETIEYDPKNTAAKWLLAQTYETYGWLDQAADLTRQILALSPDDEEAQAWLVSYEQDKSKKETPPIVPAQTSKASGKDRGNLPVKQLRGGLKQLEEGYRKLLGDAKVLLDELRLFQKMCPEADVGGQITDLKAINEGRPGTLVKIKPPKAARGVAEKIKSNSEQALEIAFADLEVNVRWIRSQGNKDSDQVREDIRKRAQGIKGALPASLRQHVDAAFMHIEHEALNKTYQNEDGNTMLGDLISAIPRSNFWVSEDGFAWDMAELAAAIKANKGVMRNPLSKQMFTADDVRSIVQHPLGRGLAALHLKQAQLTKGVRQETVSRLSTLASVLLADQEADSAASRAAVDEFLAYSATLPAAEQEALQNLRVPARDSHTGQPYDVSIGEAVDDARANRQCFHKTGDHLQQAAAFLRSNGRA